MFMNVVAIDPSLISTAMIVNGKFFNYCREMDIYTKKGLSKWYAMCEEYMTYRLVSYTDYDSYSEGELTKLSDYDRVTNMIIDDILSNIDPSKPTRVGIEGYSFSSEHGDLIDLVTFSTLLRKKILDHVTKDLTVMSPSSLKLESCKLTYPPIDVGKKKPKFEWRNKSGVSGGSFTKREMYLAIIENDSLVDEWSNHLRSIANEVLDNKTIKKPYEDINDSFLIYILISRGLV